MATNSIYFPFAAAPVTGGDFVTIDHIVGLNKLGFNACILSSVPASTFARFSVPVIASRQPLKPNDIIVISESHHSLLNDLRNIPCIKVLHNQNPYYTFFGFENSQKLNAYPLAHIIVPSNFCAQMLSKMGITQPVGRVRPFLPSYFVPAQKRLQIAFCPRKREVEAGFVMGYFRTKVPEYAHVPWSAVFQMKREDCARVMAQSAIYATFPLLEGLGLMSLEAMASGCHVVGYTGNGGQEYATADNGDWIAEGDYDSFVDKLREACRLFESKQLNPKVEAGGKTAKQFSPETFGSELRSVWLSIMGDKADLYRH
jgi:glycosyltransferase involved in cell wall biosynthesis